MVRYSNEILPILSKIRVPYHFVSELGKTFLQVLENFPAKTGSGWAPGLLQGPVEDARGLAHGTPADRPPSRRAPRLVDLASWSALGAILPPDGTRHRVG